MPNMTANEMVDSALRTIDFERSGLNALESALSNGLGKAFIEAIKIITKIKGKVIVSGVGKSGHIGTKIAATLASCGTPAHFIHPSEANHGDLGMITAQDAVIGLSWSGESQELGGILQYAKRFKIPLIAITSDKNSTLGRESNIVLELPKSKEACPNGIVPTTSTTMQLAMGDMIAVALLEEKRFSPTDFKKFHPGGQLGANLKRVKEIMHSGDELPVVSSGTDMREAIMQISEKGFGCSAVIDENNELIGVITDGDIRRHINGDLLAMTVDDVMNKNPKTVTPNHLSATALTLINTLKITSLMVVSRKKPVGIVHLHDLLRLGVV